MNEISRRWYSSESCSPGQDIVINNAAVYDHSSNDKVWRTNLLAPCYITEKLVRSFLNYLLHDMRALRIVQVGSRLESRSNMNRDTLGGIISSTVVSYADSKRGLLMHSAYMSKKYKHEKSLSFCVVTPGMVNTNLGKSSVWRLVWWLSYPLRFICTRHPIEGAVSVLWAAFGCPTETGVYLGDGVVLERIVDTRDSLVGQVLSDSIMQQF